MRHSIIDQYGRFFNLFMILYDDNSSIYADPIKVWTTGQTSIMQDDKSSNMKFNRKKTMCNQVRSSSSSSLAFSFSFTLKRSVVFQESYTTFTQTCNVDQILLQKIFMECKKEKLIRTRNLS